MLPTGVPRTVSGTLAVSRTSCRHWTIRCCPASWALVGVSLRAGLRQRIDYHFVFPVFQRDCRTRDVAIATRQRRSTRNATREFSGRSAGYKREVECLPALVSSLTDQSDEDAGQKREDERLQK